MEDIYLIGMVFFAGLLALGGVFHYSETMYEDNYFIMPDGVVCDNFNYNNGAYRYYECENGNWYYNPEVVIVRNKKGDEI